MHLAGGSTLAVFGQGPVGLSATLLGAKMGARVIAVETNPERLALAKQFGADAAVHADDSEKAMKDLTRGEGVDLALDCTGIAAARIAAVRSAKTWGTVCFVGEGGEVTLDVSRDMLRKQLTLIGSWTFSAMGQAECARFVVDNRILLELPAVREDLLERNAIVDHEARAFGLPHRAERPRADQGELLAQQVAAHIERHLATLADEADGSPGLRRANCGESRGGNPGAIERKIHAFAAGHFFQRFLSLRSVDRFIGTELLRERAPLGVRFDGDHARAHPGAEQRRAKANRSRAKHGEGRATRETHAAQRAVGGPRAAGDSRALDKAQLIGKRHERARRHLEVFGMPAMRGHAVDDDARAAQLRPADPAVLAHAATRVMVIHDALADWCLAFRNARAARRDDPAGLVPADERLGAATEAKRCLRSARRRTVELEIAAAHPRGLHLDHHLARSGRGIGEIADFDLAITEKDRSSHPSS